MVSSVGAREINPSDGGELKRFVALDRELEWRAIAGINGRWQRDQGDD